MYVDEGASATLVNCVLEGNSADFGGGLYVDYGGTATLYGCTFASNTDSYGENDIYNQGTLSVYGCAAGSYGTQGTSLSTSGYGTTSGSLFSFSGCTECAR